MAKARVRFGALLLVAMIVAAFGVLALSPSVSYAEETKLTAGATFAGARDLTPTKGGSVASKTKGAVKKGDLVVSKRNLATFDTENDNEYYKFKTSNRNSLYRITVKKEVDDGRSMEVDIRDHALRKFNTGASGVADRTYQVSFDSNNGQIARNETYYIELSRFVPESTTGSINRTPYVDYRITVEEIVPRPAAISANAYTVKLDKSAKALTFNVSNRSFYADGYTYQLYVPRLKKWITGKFSGVTGTLSNEGVRTTVSMGSAYWGYICKIRPYRSVNGKLFYGKWAKAYTKFSDGKYVKCTKTFTTGSGEKFVAGKYYNYKDKVSSLSKKQRKRFEKSGGKYVKYAEGKKAVVVN